MDGSPPHLHQRLRRDAEPQLHLLDLGAQVGERLLDEAQRRRVGDTLSVSVRAGECVQYVGHEKNKNMGIHSVAHFE